MPQVISGSKGQSKAGWINQRIISRTIATDDGEYVDVDNVFDIKNASDITVLLKVWARVFEGSGGASFRFVIKFQESNDLSGVGWTDLPNEISLASTAEATPYTSSVSLSTSKRYLRHLVFGENGADQTFTVCYDLNILSDFT